LNALEMHVGGVIPDIIIPEISHHHGLHGGHPGGHPHGPHGGHPNGDPHGPHGSHPPPTEDETEDEADEGTDESEPEPTEAEPTPTPEFVPTTEVFDKKVAKPLEPKPTKCPSAWHMGEMISVPMQDGLMGNTEGKCELKYISVCTRNRFERFQIPNCHKRKIRLTYAKIVNELTTLAITGDGNRRCVYSQAMVDCKLTSFGGLKTAVEYVDQIEKLASALFESCGKDGLRDYLGPMVSTLKELTNDHTCSSRSLFPFTFDYSTSMPPTTESGQRLIGIEAERLIGGKQCHARSFGARASTTFNARSFNVINMESARESFATIVNVLSKLDRHNLKQLGEFTCNLPGGKLPCELLSMPRNEEGCQLTQRVERLYNFVKTQCDPDFAATYDHVMESLIQHSRPTVNDCMPPGEPMLSNKAGQEMAALFQE
jgi:hypothetical protein